MMVIAAALVFSVALVCSAYLIQRAIALASQQHAELMTKVYEGAIASNNSQVQRMENVVAMFLEHIESTQVIGGQPVRLAQEQLELDAETELAKRGVEQLNQVTSFARRRAQEMANKIISQQG